MLVMRNQLVTLVISSVRCQEIFCVGFGHSRTFLWGTSKVLYVPFKSVSMCSIVTNNKLMSAKMTCSGTIKLAVDSISSTSVLKPQRDTIWSLIRSSCALQTCATVFIAQALAFVRRLFTIGEFKSIWFAIDCPRHSKL